ncbi:hydrogenase maturation protease [Gandjariella thermophila]|uniref:Peptidase M52 n=1 Tax=Gandjariella thermophila TaxID=1931992 RepID=A0A4D4J449_9PSEU|nr:hydrogenase maturation protease [Gandjariella thermophila]GDY28757.1 peptidase M52 [Gandjariella thermophila]
MTPRVLVAGIGNIFLGDDGFGVEVARRLAEQPLPDWVQVADYGISGMRLAYDLLGGYHTTILVDAAARGGQPGTVYLIELDRRAPAPKACAAAVHGAGPAGPAPKPSVDAHGMTPDAVLDLLALLGGDAGRVLVVGCEPADTSQGIGLSPPVAGAVDEAVRIVRELIDRRMR